MTGSTRGPTTPSAANASSTPRSTSSPTGQVPLGSLTYYFDDMQHLLTGAFTRLAESVSLRYGALLEAAQSPEEAQEAVVEIVCGKVWGTDRNLLLSYELYAFATRHPEVRAVMRAWMQASRDSLARHFDPLTARALDALVEGLSIHNSVDSRPTSRTEVTAIVDAIVNRHTRGSGR